MDQAAAKHTGGKARIAAGSGKHTRFVYIPLSCICIAKGIKTEQHVPRVGVSQFGEQRGDGATLRAKDKESNTNSIKRKTRQTCTWKRRPICHKLRAWVYRTFLLNPSYCPPLSKVKRARHGVTCAILVRCKYTCTVCVCVCACESVGARLCAHVRVYRCNTLMRG